jgi:RNA polymerase sigma-70 factor (ECF subfamily)
MDDIRTTKLLVAESQKGNRSALNELCDRYISRVLVAVRARLGDGLRRKVESWDIVQEVMIDAIRDVEDFSFRTEGAFLNYLNRVVENRIRDEADRWAAKKRHPDHEVQLDAARSNQSANPLQIADAGPTPSRIVALTDELTRLEAAITQLPDEYRDLIIAAKIEGRSYQELAEESGKTSDAIRMQVGRAMIALGKVFRRMSEDGREDERG